jgi:hypothetical protein
MGERGLKNMLGKPIEVVVPFDVIMRMVVEVPDVRDTLLFQKLVDALANR